MPLFRSCICADDCPELFPASVAEQCESSDSAVSPNEMEAHQSVLKTRKRKVSYDEEDEDEAIRKEKNRLAARRHRAVRKLKEMVCNGVCSCLSIYPSVIYVCISLCPSLWISLSLSLSLTCSYFISLTFFLLLSSSVLSSDVWLQELAP